MKKLYFALFSSLLILISLFLFPPESFAGEIQEGSCSWSFTNENEEPVPPAFFIKKTISYLNKVGFTVGGLADNNEYKLHAACSSGLGCGDSRTLFADKDGKITHYFNFRTDKTNDDIFLMVDDVKKSSSFNPICKYHIPPTDWQEEQAPPSPYQASCALELRPSRNIKMNMDLRVVGTITETSGMTDYSIFCTNPWPGSPEQPTCSLNLKNLNETKSQQYTQFTVDNLSSPKTFSVNLGNGFPDDEYAVDASVLINPKGQTSFRINCSMIFKIPDGMPSCFPPNTCVEIGVGICNKPAPYLGSCPANAVCCIPPTPTPPEWCNRCVDCGGDCILCPPCIGSPPVPPLPSLAPLCEQLPAEFVGDCKKCINSPKGNPPGEGGIWTAIGCLPTDLPLLVKDVFFVIGLSVAGGIAFLYLIYGGFIFLTSSGNPERLAHGKEIIVSAMSGLLLIIFSIFLLRVIGVDILQLPGFT